MNSEHAVMLHFEAVNFSNVLNQLRTAENEYQYNRDKLIMDGRPVRVINECKSRLKNILDHPLPEKELYPELHAYMVEQREIADAKAMENRKIADAKAEEERKLNEYMMSPEGMRKQRKKKIKELETSLRGFEREHEHCQSEATNYVLRATNAKQSIEITKHLLYNLKSQD